MDARSDSNTSLHDVTLLIMSALFVLASLGYFLLPFGGELREFFLYVVLALSIGALCLVPVSFPKFLKVTPVVLASVAVLYYSWSRFSLGAAISSLCIWGVIATSYKLSRKSAAVFFVFLFVLWQFFVKLQWLDSFDLELLHLGHKFVVFCLVTILSAAWIRYGHKLQKIPRFLEWTLIAIFAGLFLLCATRPEIDFHHWSFFLGPIQLLKQGHWLLWDVPCQYGFLNVLLASILPFESPLSSLYVLNATTLFATACLSFYLLHSNKRNLSSLVFAGITVFIVTFLFPGWIQELRGPTPYPSFAALRYVWCYVLTFNCVRMLQARDGISSNRHLYIGTLVWTVALFWSIESAIYASCIWLPFCAIVWWGRLEGKNYNFFHRSVLILRNFFLAGLMPLATVMAIAIYYIVRLGHGPDWYGYIEYALAYASGFGSQLIEYHGAVWTLLFILSLFTAMALFAVRRKSFLEFAVATSLIGLIWGTGTYFVSRSHDNTLANLAPVTVFALSIALILAKRFEELEIPTWRLTIQSVISAIFIVASVATLGNEKNFNTFTKSVWKSRTLENLHQELPAFSSEVIQSMVSAGYNPDAPVIFLGNTLFPSWGDEKYFYNLWLPVAPNAEFVLLTRERQKTYIQRFLELSSVPEGWIVLTSFGISPQLGAVATMIPDYKITERQKVPFGGFSFLHLFKCEKKIKSELTQDLAIQQ
jgi:hypothetical protein